MPADQADQLLELAVELAPRPPRPPVLITVRPQEVLVAGAARTALETIARQSGGRPSWDPALRVWRMPAGCADDVARWAASAGRSAEITREVRAAGPDPARFVADRESEEAS